MVRRLAKEAVGEVPIGELLRFIEEDREGFRQVFRWCRRPQEPRLVPLGER